MHSENEELGSWSISSDGQILNLFWAYIISLYFQYYCAVIYYSTRKIYQCKRLSYGSFFASKFLSVTERISLFTYFIKELKMKILNYVMPLFYQG